MQVPFLDLKAAYDEIRDEIDAAVSRVLRSGWYVGGSEVSIFEEEWAAFCGADHCVGTGNGLDALVLALRACGVGPGDAVIVPSHTFIATWLAVSAVGAIVQPVEPDPSTYNIDASRIESVITAKTRAIIPVHLYGQPADIDPIIRTAKKHGLMVIEDAAQAHGARYKGKRIGCHGDVVCWSFYPGKNLGAMGDAGAVTTNNAGIAARVRQLGNYGSVEKYVHEEKGANSRLDPVQAAILSVKLAHLERWNDRRKTIADIYAKALQHRVPTLPKEPEWADSVWHLYVIQTEGRDKLQSGLQSEAIGTLIHYPTPPHMHKAFRDLIWSERSFPLSEQLSSSILSLPIGPHMLPDQVDEVIRVIKCSI